MHFIYFSFTVMETGQARNSVPQAERSGDNSGRSLCQSFSGHRLTSALLMSKAMTSECHDYSVLLSSSGSVLRGNPQSHKLWIQDDQMFILLILREISINYLSCLSFPKAGGPRRSHSTDARHVFTHGCRFFLEEMARDDIYWSF